MCWISVLIGDIGADEDCTPSFFLGHVDLFLGSGGRLERLRQLGGVGRNHELGLGVEVLLRLLLHLALALHCFITNAEINISLTQPQSPQGSHCPLPEAPGQTQRVSWGSQSFGKPQLVQAQEAEHQRG